MSRRPPGEREKDIERLRKALKKSRTMDDLVATLDVDRRTVYRYLDDLQEQGVQVTRVGLSRPTRYQIVA